ncbi:hypothetical protein L484_012809 [Morus notabilis]|uniref:Uncharacterized protein n=1 Tax=Morus notabilis TaxID=981085 RepID=W9R416_9ROSA|nr:hypothetical protein L484_012809 [Morus notabilis]
MSFHRQSQVVPLSVSSVAKLTSLMLITSQYEVVNRYICNHKDHKIINILRELWINVHQGSIYCSFYSEMTLLLSIYCSLLCWCMGGLVFYRVSDGLLF